MSRISEIILHLLVNSVWQVAAVAAGASICSGLMRKIAARYRHIMWVAALVICVALPLIGILNIRVKNESFVYLTRHDIINEVTPVTSTTEVSSPRLKAAESDSLPSSTRWYTDVVTGLKKPLMMPSYASRTIVIVYLLFLLYRIGLLIRKWSKAQAFRRAAVIIEPSPVLASIATRCEQAFHLNNVTLSFSRSAPAPGTVGALTPVIVLPAGSNADTSEEILASMVAHEMAHIARRDYALNLVYEFLIVPISFHPVALAIKRQIGRTRELACDDLVTGRLLEAEGYARSLVGVAGTLVPRTGQALTLGVFDADILEERIMKLTQDTKRLGKTASNMISLCCLCFLFLTGVAASSFSLELRTSDPQIRQRAPHNLNDANREIADGSGAFVQDSNATRAAAHQLTSGSSSDDAQARADAACAAAKARDFGAIPYLILMLADDTSIQAGTCLEEGRWSPALHRLKHPSPGEQAAIALASMGTPALEPLTKALGASSPVTRRNAAWAIGELTNMDDGERAGTVPGLIALLKDGDEWVRTAAARALGEIRDERAADPLMAELADTEARVRDTSSWALGEMKEHRAVTALCSLLRSDQDGKVRKSAAWALGEIQDKRAVGTLCEVLGSDSHPEARVTVVWALGEIQDKSSVDAVCNALRSDSHPEVRVKAAWALGEIQDRKSVETLCNALLTDSEAEVRKNAAWALGEIQSPVAIGVLHQALQDSNAEVRDKAKRAILEIEGSDN